MKTIFKLLLLLLFANVYKVKATCQVTFNGSLCVCSPITFTGELAGTTHSFDFNGEAVSTGQRIVNHIFKTAGSKTITYITTIGGNKCTSTLNLVIKESPKSKLRLLSAYQQCFANNNFCLKDSSYSPIGASINKITWSIAYDSQTFVFENRPLPFINCFKFKHAWGGTISIYHTIEDANGCEVSDTWNSMAKVSPQLVAKFTTSSKKNPGCDSVDITFENTSSINKNDIQLARWAFGDGEYTDSFGPTITHRYKHTGIYDAGLKLKAKDGCEDYLQLNKVAIIVKSNPKIVSDTDSACISNASVRFMLDEIPLFANNYQWNFGDPVSGVSNINKTDSFVAHNFSKPGPYQVKLSLNNTICGNRIMYDTVLILGPWSNIEKPNNRIAEYEVYQCTKDVQDSIHFKNLSTFYHNDRNQNNDDSTIFINGKMQHVFSNAQISLNPKNYSEAQNRKRTNTIRLWDFGDNYSSKCTTDVATNKNVNCNCNYSRDSMPVHYYGSWDKIMLRNFKNTAMEDAVFFESNRLCKKVLVYPSDSFYIIEDTLIVVPKNHADSLLAKNYSTIKTKYYLQEKYFYNGERAISDYVDIKILAGESVIIKTAGGSTFFLNGPATFSLTPGCRITSKDTVRFLFTKTIKRDTLPSDFYQLRKKKGENPGIISKYKKNYSGTNGFDYTINYNRFRALYYSKIPTAFTAKLIHKDTVNAMRCESESSKQIILMNPDAGGIGSGLRIKGLQCYGSSNALYGITFLLGDLKPGTSFSDVRINYDSSCGKNNFVPLNALSPGGLPPGPPYQGYGLAGNVPNTFSHQYSESEICSKDGFATIGIIVGNGVSKTGNKPLCADTQWYHNMFSMPRLNADFKIISKPKSFTGDCYKICKHDEIKFQHPFDNQTKTADIGSIRYELGTTNASPQYNLKSNRYVQEDYHFNSPIKDSAKNKIYNYLIVTRGGQDPVRVAKTDNWVEGVSKIYKKPDTIVTAVITKWDTIADISNAWDYIKPQLISKGFDPFSIDGKTLAHMIWNKKGTIGNPATGAKGCLDTVGFGNLINFQLIPVNGYKKILHYRDTSLRPVDLVLENGISKNEYVLTPEYNGYYLAGRRMVSNKSKCDADIAYAVVVGFAAMYEMPDSIAGENSGTLLTIRPDFRYFNSDPINNGTWDLYDYWRDSKRQFDGKPNREPITKYDWNKADDDTVKKQTIFGGAPYGGSGMGGPWVQLGGGGAGALYYKKCGKYLMRIAAGDSSGCTDTFSRTITITGIKANFGIEVSTPSCNSIIEFFDSSILCAPCNLNKDTCDFITRWEINWGDGSKNIFQRNSTSQPGLPPRIGHKYSSNGWRKIVYGIQTKQGALDSQERWVKIPGPRPSFKFDGTLMNEAYIYQHDSITFVNTSDSQSGSADFTWFWGDGKISNSPIAKIDHVYDDPGDFYVFLQLFDSVVLGKTIRKFCPATFPDTFSKQPAYIVHVVANTKANFATKDKILIYPNPTAGEILFSGSTISEVEIYSIAGGFIRKAICVKNTANLSDLNPGVYLIKGRTKEGLSFETRLIVLK